MTKRYSPDINSPWVNQTLASLTLQQKIGQLLHPYLMPAMGVDKALEALDSIEVGGAFFFTADLPTLRQLNDKLQARHHVPVVVASDLENGAGRMVDGAVVFPDNMAVAATGKSAYAYTMGEAAAKEGRDVGIHWAFGPVMDINRNPHNPITNTRSFGDDTQTIADFGLSMIAGMQDNDFAACAKHFPGDGFDDRDQHLVTTVNPLSEDQWWAQSGQMFQKAIDNGVWTIMIGHIALPWCDPSPDGDIANAPSAVVSHAITSELLRKRMGFEGLIISDAIGMGGSTTHYDEDEVTIRALEAGCDMILFCKARRAFNAIMGAVESGRLSQERIDLSVRRILALKETLGLHQGTATRPCSSDDRKRFASAATAMAHDALTLVKNTMAPGSLPLKKGMKVLSVHIRGDKLYHVDGVDGLLKDEGLEVKRWCEEDPFEFADWHDFSAYDALLVHTVFGPTWATGRIRMGGNYMRPLTELLKSHHQRIVIASFGNPYQIYEFPRVSCYLNCYSPDPHSQRAYVDFLMGRLSPQGKSPVDLDKLLQSPATNRW